MSFVLLVVVIFVVVHFFGAVALGHVLGNAIGAPVSVGRLHVGIFSSSLALYRLKIKNPEGFHEKTLAEIHEVSIHYNLPDFFRGKVHLENMRLDFGDVTIEKSNGKVNLLELGAVKGITKGIGSGQEKGKPGKPGEAKKGAPKGPELQIDEVLVNIGKVHYVEPAAQPPVDKEYDLGIHNESFKNVTKPSSLVKGIAFLILRKVGLSSLTSNFDILLKGVGGEVKSTLDKLL